MDWLAAELKLGTAWSEELRGVMEESEKLGLWTGLLK